MAIDARSLLERRFAPVRQRWGWRDAVSYALALGLGDGEEAWDADVLPFLYEQGTAPLRIVPGFACVLGDPGFWMREPGTGMDWARLVHAQQDTEWFGALPPEGEAVGQEKVVQVWDRGEGKGAVYVIEREVSDAASGRLLARLRMTVLGRGDGGFGGEREPRRISMPWPQREPDLVVSRRTLTQSPLLYRLSADPNPLHADPAVARAAGFERPILHGLCSYGLLSWIVVRQFADGAPARLRSLSLRFTAPVYPGDTLRCEFWREAERVLFRVRSTASGGTVLDRGEALLEKAP
jgi:acyl dehydratase